MNRERREVRAVLSLSGWEEQRRREERGGGEGEGRKEGEERNGKREEDEEGREKLETTINLLQKSEENAYTYITFFC